MAVSDHATDQLFVLFNDPAGLALLRGRGVSEDVIAALPHFGLSSICNIVAAIKTAKTLGLGASQAMITVATDGAAMYTSENRQGHRPSTSAAGFDGAQAARPSTAHITQRDHRARAAAEPRSSADRIFNLGYFTWVEQRGVELADFEARRDQGFWRGLHAWLPAWDERSRPSTSAHGAA